MIITSLANQVIEVLLYYILILYILEVKPKLKLEVFRIIANML